MKITAFFTFLICATISCSKPSLKSFHCTGEVYEHLNSGTYHVVDVRVTFTTLEFLSADEVVMNTYEALNWPFPEVESVEIDRVENAIDLGNGPQIVNFASVKDSIFYFQTDDGIRISHDFEFPYCTGYYHYPWLELNTSSIGDSLENHVSFYPSVADESMATRVRMSIKPQWEVVLSDSTLVGDGDGTVYNGLPPAQAFYKGGTWLTYILELD